LSYDLYELIIKKEYPLVTYYIYKLSNRKRSFVIYIVENGFYPRTMRIFTSRRKIVNKFIDALRNNDYDEISNVLYELYLRFIM